MFNQSKFNKSPFNRSSSFSVPFGMNFYAQGNQNLNLRVQIQLTANLTGGGATECYFYTVTEIQVPTMESVGGITISDLVLFVVPMTPPVIAGEGNISCDLVCQTPLDSLGFTGDGNYLSTDYAQQVMTAELRSDGYVLCSIEMPTYLEPFDMDGYGSLNDPYLLIPLDLVSNFGGGGFMVLRRLTEIGYSVIELIGVDVGPGGSVSINTDLLTVLVNGLEDVSSVTSESEFFELEPGDTEVQIEFDGGENAAINVHALWQNRWL